MTESQLQDSYCCPLCGMNILARVVNGKMALLCSSGHNIAELGRATPKGKRDALLRRLHFSLSDLRSEDKMNIYKTELFPYIAGDSLVGKEVPVTIKAFSAEMISGQQGEEQGYLLYFERTPKPLILNKTNAKAIARKYGPETDEWIGKPLILYAERLKAFGEWHNAARVKVPPNGAKNAPPTGPEWDELGIEPQEDDGPPDDIELLSMVEFYRAVTTEIPYFAKFRPTRIGEIIAAETGSETPFEAFTNRHIFDTLQAYASQKADAEAA
jgi:hypothetical protein